MQAWKCAAPFYGADSWQPVAKGPRRIRAAMHPAWTASGSGSCRSFRPAGPAAPRADRITGTPSAVSGASPDLTSSTAAMPTRRAPGDVVDHAVADHHPAFGGCPDAVERGLKDAGVRLEVAVVRRRHRGGDERLEREVGLERVQAAVGVRDQTDAVAGPRAGPRASARRRRRARSDGTAPTRRRSRARTPRYRLRPPPSGSEHATRSAGTALAGRRRPAAVRAPPMPPAPRARSATHRRAARGARRRPCNLRRRRPIPDG